MSKYFDHVAQQLHSRIQQAKVFITKHNATTGALAEAVLREFLQEHLPRGVSVEEGFIIDAKGGLSKQCDIIIYDSHHYAPFYRAGQVVVLPAEAVIAVIEVKTSITRPRFHDVIKYFASFKRIEGDFRTYLFLYDAPEIQLISRWFQSYRHTGQYQAFDHDTFQLLPDEIVGLDHSYLLFRDYVVTDTDCLGYLSFFFEDLEGSAINALELFFLSIYDQVETYLQAYTPKKLEPRQAHHAERKLEKALAIELGRT